MLNFRPVSSAYYQNKVAIITGGASGIGRALAEELIKYQTQLVIIDWNEKLLSETEASLKSKGGKVRSWAVDVSDLTKVQEVVTATIAEFQQIDFLFSNAGVGIAGEVRDFSIEDWRPVIDVNLGGVINGIVAVYPQMVRQGHGHIVNTASLAGLTPHPGTTPYTAAKYAVVGLSTSLRIEATGLGVKISVACPGPVETGILESTNFVNIDREKALNSFPVKKISASRCAIAILQGVQSNKSIIVISPFAWQLYWLQRLVPDILINVESRIFEGFRQARLQP